MRKNLEGELKRTKDYYNKNIREFRFKIGDPVYYLHKSVKKEQIENYNVFFRDLE